MLLSPPPKTAPMLEPFDCISTTTIRTIETINWIMFSAVRRSTNALLRRGLGGSRRPRAADHKKDAPLERTPALYHALPPGANLRRGTAAPIIGRSPSGAGDDVDNAKEISLEVCALCTP